MQFYYVFNMELRSFNVERIYRECVKCIIGDTLCVDKKTFKKNRNHIKSMLSQIETCEGSILLCMCNRRKDGEIWTPYLQIVEMLIRMGIKMGYVECEGKLKMESIITIKI